MHVSYISHLVTKIWFPPEAKTPPIPPPAYIFVIKAHNNEQRRKLSLKYNQSKVQETYAWQLENILWSKNDFCSKFFFHNIDRHQQHQHILKQHDHIYTSPFLCLDAKDRFIIALSTHNIS